MPLPARPPFLRRAAAPSLACFSGGLRGTTHLLSKRSIAAPAADLEHDLGFVRPFSTEVVSRPHRRYLLQQSSPGIYQSPPGVYQNPPGVYPSPSPLASPSPLPSPSPSPLPSPSPSPLPSPSPSPLPSPSPDRQGGDESPSPAPQPSPSPVPPSPLPNPDAPTCDGRAYDGYAGDLSNCRVGFLARSPPASADFSSWDSISGALAAQADVAGGAFVTGRPAAALGAGYLRPALASTPMQVQRQRQQRA